MSPRLQRTVSSPRKGTDSDDVIEAHQASVRDHTDDVISSLTRDSDFDRISILMNDDQDIRRL